MTVHFIGAGPGAADLLTVRAAPARWPPPVCLYAGSLSRRRSAVLLPARHTSRRHRGPDARRDRRRDGGGARGGTGRGAACSGDPSVLSALTEQIRRLDAAGVPYDVTPGVPSFAAAAAVLRRELTVPAVGQSVVLTRTPGRRRRCRRASGWPALAATGATLACTSRCSVWTPWCPSSREHYGWDCPVAVVQRASQPGEVVLRGTSPTSATRCARPASPPPR